MVIEAGSLARSLVFKSNEEEEVKKGRQRAYNLDRFPSFIAKRREEKKTSFRVKPLILEEVEVEAPSPKSSANWCQPIETSSPFSMEPPFHSLIHCQVFVCIGLFSFYFFFVF